jgi:hypothetical protein
VSPPTGVTVSGYQFPLTCPDFLGQRTLTDQQWRKGCVNGSTPDAGPFVQSPSTHPCVDGRTLYNTIGGYGFGGAAPMRFSGSVSDDPGFSYALKVCAGAGSS